MGWYTIRPKWYLTQWKAIVKHRDELSGNMQETARILFASLKQLSKEDVQVLYEKYYETDKGTNFYYLIDDFSKYTPDSDKVIAERKGMRVADYTRERVSAEKRLQAVISRVGKQLTTSDLEQLERYVLRLGSLYLKDYHKTADNCLNADNIVFTANKTQAKRFSRGSTDGEALVRGLRLEKGPSEGEGGYRYVSFNAR
ncbi:hypothetical protein ACQUEP_15415 [Enterococcus casseliflavus]|uniref:hypothetical protein n=1 Tax=Enterococcus TaxID=1350 RepID=UPI00225577A1|nr:hypothetical protein [Enterococcus casseliflavus]MCX4167652.1 hypothetical protein [Enterococcus casseliflavus]MDT2987751.1 hypothetical protein [Enterococcus casseliflavus]MDV7702622.1 hypothetical protein [Enterococcus casseliflavus]